MSPSIAMLMTLSFLWACLSIVYMTYFHSVTTQIFSSWERKARNRWVFQAMGNKNWPHVGPACWGLPCSIFILFLIRLIPGAQTQPYNSRQFLYIVDRTTEKAHTIRRDENGPVQEESKGQKTSVTVSGGEQTMKLWWGHWCWIHIERGMNAVVGAHPFIVYVLP